jgi:hypothetical protein
MSRHENKPKSELPGRNGAVIRGDTQNTLKKRPTIRANAEEEEEEDVTSHNYDRFHEL